MPPKEKLELLNLEKFSVMQLPELQGKKEEIKSVIDANPIVEIISTETYEAAKKSRTAVKSLRTGLEKEQKDVKRKIKERILDVVDKEYDSLVSDVKIQETLRQDSVDVWEAEIEKRRLEKIRLEQERVDNIKLLLSTYSDEWKAKFSSLVFEDIEKVSGEFYESYTNYDATTLQEFEKSFPLKVEELTDILNNKIMHLEDAEKSNAKKAIGEFYVAWGSKLNYMVYENAEETVKLFKEQKKLVLSIPELQEEYDVKFLEINKQLSEKAKSLLDTKLANDKLEKERKELAIKEEKAQKERDKFAKEKADFEKEKQVEKEKSDHQLKVDGRIQQLVELGLKFDFQQTFVGHECFIDVLDIKTYDDPKWDKMISDIENKIANPVEEVAAPEVVDDKQIKTIPATINESFVEKLIPIVEKQDLADLKEAQKEASWDNIFNDFKLSGEKSLSTWLKINYNVPTKIN